MLENVIFNQKFEKVVSCGQKRFSKLSRGRAVFRTGTASYPGRRERERHGPWTERERALA
eukprot:12643478-Alexandrium_andersonii.AAC.1